MSSVGELLVASIRLYQRYVSPLFPPRCRFDPSCSQYAIEAIRMHGMVLGCGYALWRIIRCQPWCGGGHDPVPIRRRFAR